jgi:indolepyruvate ferredoxin oxidoreductase
VFGYTAERKAERRLIREYEATLKDIAATLTPDNHPFAIEVARVPEQIRGFGHVKQRNLGKASERQSALLEAFRNPPAVVAIAAE